MAEVSCDTLVIGSGPGGYVAAIRAAQLGQQVICVEKESWGGVCLNWGCIPTKALLYASTLLSEIKTAGDYGIKVSGVSFDWAALRNKKESIVTQMTRGVEALLKGNKATTLKGTVSFLNANQAEVKSPTGTDLVRFKSAIIATGTEPSKLPFLPVDGDLVFTSKEALELRRAPKKIAILGAGAIGAEFADIYRAFGAEVHLLEMMDEILPSLDKEAAKLLHQLFEKKGIKVYTATKVTDAAIKGKESVTLNFSPLTSPAQVSSLTVDAVLVAIGLKGYTDGLQLQKAGLSVDQKGFIKVDSQMRTSVPNLFAIGDVAGGKLLAHKASHEGIVAAEAIAGKKSVMHYRAVPYAVFTDPEVAGVGLTEEEAATEGIKVRAGKFPFRALGKAIGVSKTDGFVKILTDADSGEIVGAHLIGAHAGDYIAELTLALEMNATAEDIAATIHVHPTMPEAVMEAALDAEQRVIHLVKKY
ncbi:MAG TPA: dihydrolipoyl dehydrogenase [candidate division Zixibacteria bacterium]|nr:dihydrolipoyl dehydrogenase [candidate division Zixibacteria bacterium]